MDPIVFGHCAFEWNNNSLPSELLRLCSASNKKRKLSDTDACSLKLFNGETSYSGSQRDVLKNMISDANRMEVSGGPEMLVQLRGKSHDYDRSDLEDICMELLCESEEARNRSCFEMFAKSNLLNYFKKKGNYVQRKENVFKYF